MSDTSFQAEELTLGHLKSAQACFMHAVRACEQVIDDIKADRLDDNAKVTLTLTIVFEPTQSLESVEVSCHGAVKLPKGRVESVHALRRLGKLKVMKAEQTELPGIRGPRGGQLRSVDATPEV